jgi:two-component system, chemotaxis family, sensor kinase CheA
VEPPPPPRVEPPPPPRVEPPPPQASAPVTPLVEETVRVATAKLASLLLLSEEMVSAKLSVSQHAVQMRELRTAHGSWHKEWARILPDMVAAGAFVRRFAANGGELSGEDGRSLLKVFEFLDWNAAFLKSLETRSASYLKSAERDSRTLGGMVDSLLEEVKKVMMFPFASLLEAFPKIVRDLSRDHGKEVKLVVRGEELEIDRRILEELKDPLIHLVRNCISHGIELPSEREQKQKQRRGTISIDIEPREGRAEVVVSDDGAGIDVERLRSSLTRQGVVAVEKAAEMSSAELLPFIFLSGVSTSPTVTEISGRGLGLAIVREKVEKLGGSVSLETEPGHGTSFRIVLPLSVATFRGILVQVAERVFVLPAIHVERAVRTKREEVATVENREIIDLGGRMVALARLADVLELGGTDHLPEQLQAVVVTVGEQSVAFVVDEVLNEREVRMKRMGPQLSRVRNIAGATLLGSGKVVPILNVPDLIKSVTGGHLAAGPTMAPPVQEATRQRGRHILVVEDSITSRTLLKNILESAGYSVTTAVDGVEAMTRLKEGRFDLVVSDVDMPRMNGFELTAKIRADRDLNELPVVLVTALGSREDRERGVDAGASAYIVKGSFNQSDLLETVQRLC